MDKLSRRSIYLDGQAETGDGEFGEVLGNHLRFKMQSGVEVSSGEKFGAKTDLDVIAELNKKVKPKNRHFTVCKTDITSKSHSSKSS